MLLVSSRPKELSPSISSESLFSCRQKISIYPRARLSSSWPTTSCQNSSQPSQTTQCFATISVVGARGTISPREPTCGTTLSTSPNMCGELVRPLSARPTTTQTTSTGEFPRILFHFNFALRPPNSTLRFACPPESRPTAIRVLHLHVLTSCTRRHNVVHLCGGVKDSRMFKHQGEVLNPYQKPLSLMGKFLKAFTVPGDYIVDVTAGSCTTAVRLTPCLAYSCVYIVIYR